MEAAIAEIDSVKASAAEIKEELEGKVAELENQLQ